MSVVDVKNKTLTVKLVYYGCALGGKTTNLQTLHELTDPDSKHGMVSIATKDDRTLFFDLMPMDLGQIGGLTVRVKLYTVPGQVHYELTRRQVLAGTDGVVMVVDSSPEAAKSNQWAIENLGFNLKANGLDPKVTPTVLQWNKRDLPNARPVADLQQELNPRDLPAFEAVAFKGPGVVETFAGLLKQVIREAYRKIGKTGVKPSTIDEKIDLSLKDALERGKQAGEIKEPERTFDHRFDMDRYREEQVEERGRDRRIVDQESLLSEAVTTNMALAEKLDDYSQSVEAADRRARMMEALGKLAPALSAPEGPPFPDGMLADMLGRSGRKSGSILLFKAGEETMVEREVVPGGRDPLNLVVSAGIGSVAFRLSKEKAPKIVDDIQNELFFGATPPGAERLASVLVAPLACDGLAFGSICIYTELVENPLDEAEIEFWTAVSTLFGLSLHWRALRNKLSAAKA